jgi:predicted GNAT family acetyltransferase
VIELDNPIWAALTTAQRSIAVGTGLARCYPAEMSRLAGLEGATPAAFSDLAALVAPGDAVGLFTADPVELPDEWRLVRGRPIEQMLCREPPPAGPSPSGQLALGDADVPEMLALAALTDPGPFLPETIRMGRYIGIRSADGRLVAMAGERLRLAGFTEISAVCTDPEFQGRGHARALVVALATQTFAEERLPFLHVKSENGAKALYEKLGFVVRRIIHLTVLVRR